MGAIAPALAAGCTIVLKPAEQAPLSPLMLGQLCAEAGIPGGRALASGIASGSVGVICYQVLDVAMPLGGYKLSGFGREGGSDHLEQYLNTQAVYVRHARSPWNASS